MLFYFACEAAGALCARHSLRPLFLEARIIMHHSGASASRECEGVCAQIHGRRPCESRDPYSGTSRWVQMADAFHDTNIGGYGDEGVALTRWSRLALRLAGTTPVLLWRV